jgi:hypothetical protein
MAEVTFQEVLALGKVGCSPPSPEFLAWLGSKKAPDVVIELFASGVPRARKSRLWKRWEFYSESQIREEADRSPRYLSAGLLAVGTCQNGDPIALDIRKNIGAIGFISHDIVWEDEEAPIRRNFVSVAPSLAEFARRARDGAVPIDYWEAKGRK